MASKYDAFWAARASDLARLIDAAAQGQAQSLNVSEIQGWGERISWLGTAIIQGNRVSDARMAHLSSLARLVVQRGWCAVHPDYSFRFTVDAAMRLNVSATYRPRAVRATDTVSAVVEPDKKAFGERAAAPTTPSAVVSSLATRLSPGQQRPALDPESACAALHDILAALPEYTSPEQVPFQNGLYVFYQRGEASGHAPGERIVRIGNHPRSDNRLLGRLRDHYRTLPGAKNASVFRRYLGGALLRRNQPSSLCLAPAPGQGHWEKQGEPACPACASYEERVSDFLRANVSFRCLRIDNRVERNYFEARLVATVAACPVCTPSPKWLGRDCYSAIVRTYGLWNSEFTTGATLTERELERLQALAAATPGYRAAAIPNDDLSSTLLLIPCCAGKNGQSDPGLPVLSVADMLSPEAGQLLEEGRRVAFARTAIDRASPLRPALAYYTGYPYANGRFRSLLIEALRAGLHCLIISGGYGVLRPEEPIHNYQAHLSKTRTIWRTRLPRILRDYVERNGIRRTAGVFSRDYAGVVPVDLTGDDRRLVQSFEPGVDAGTPLQAVPRKVGIVLGDLLEAGLQTPGVNVG